MYFRHYSFCQLYVMDLYIMESVCRPPVLNQSSLVSCAHFCVTLFILILCLSLLFSPFFGSFFHPSSLSFFTHDSFFLSFFLHYNFSQCVNIVMLGCCSCWCLYRYQCDLPECFGKIELWIANLISVNRKRHNVKRRNITDTSGLYDYPFNCYCPCVCVWVCVCVCVCECLLHSFISLYLSFLM